MIKQMLIVGIGGALGSMLRYGSSFIFPFRSFPWPTLVVNILGCFIIGIVIAFSLRNEPFFDQWKLFLATGICGGFTTFSAFSLESVSLFQHGKTGTGILYITASLLGGLAATWMGYKTITQLTS